VVDTATAEPIVREIHIDAQPETVFEFFTDPGKITRWLATEATLDPRPGGICHQVHAGDDDRHPGPYYMHGEFVEVTPPNRVVFTWGFTNPEVRVPSGSTTVEVTLVPEGQGTRLRLVHRDLPASELDSHREGWDGMLDRLAAAVVAMAAERP
jgi:uncharacterized protein YndB with AHSA1/START domain